jgi:hypothetical protein
MRTGSPNDAETEARFPVIDQTGPDGRVQLGTRLESRRRQNRGRDGFTPFDGHSEVFLAVEPEIGPPAQDAQGEHDSPVCGTGRFAPALPSLVAEDEIRIDTVSFR